MNIIWLSPDGDDATGTGTESNPYKTLAKGVSVFTNGDQLRLKTGTYSVTSTLTLSAVTGSILGDGGVEIVTDFDCRVSICFKDCSNIYVNNCTIKNYTTTTYLFGIYSNQPTTNIGKIETCSFTNLIATTDKFASGTEGLFDIVDCYFSVIMSNGSPAIPIDNIYSLSSLPTAQSLFFMDTCSNFTFTGLTITQGTFVVTPAAVNIWTIDAQKAVLIEPSTTTEYAFPGENQYTIWAYDLDHAFCGGDSADPTHEFDTGVWSGTGTLGSTLESMNGIASGPVIYAVGADDYSGAPGSLNGRVWKFDSGTHSWSNVKTEASYAFFDVLVESSTKLWVCGSERSAIERKLSLLKYDSGWVDYTVSLAAITGYQHPAWPLGTFSVDNRLSGIWKSPNGNIFCSGGLDFDDPGSLAYDAEPIILHNKSGSFVRDTTHQNVFNGRYIYFRRMTGLAENNFFCIAQDDDLSEHTIWQFNGSAWTEIYTQATGGILSAAATFYDIATTATDLYVCGSGRSSGFWDNGIIIKYNYATTTWSIVLEDVLVWQYYRIILIET